MPPVSSVRWHPELTTAGRTASELPAFPARKAIDDFDFDQQLSLKRDVIAHLGTWTSSWPGTTWSSSALRERARRIWPALGLKACEAGHRVAFATAAEWVARLGDAHAQARLQSELTRPGRVPLLVIDEVGYIPFEAEAANLSFQLVSSRYERASVIVTSNKAFGRWGEVLGDAAVAGAIIDRLVHHATVVNPKGDSYRSRTATSVGCLPTTLRDRIPRRGVNVQPAKGGAIFRHCGPIKENSDDRG